MMWRKLALCRTMGFSREKLNELFFPDSGLSQQEAKEICNACPVTNQCLEYALKNRIEHGIWGGTSERQRRRMRRERRWTA